MLENITMALYRYPAFFRKLGAALYNVGGAGFIAGLFAQVSKLAASTATGMAGQPPVTSIAQLLPGVPTWWVPESLAGVVAYALMGAAGAALAFAARNAARQLRSW
jgi:hypothetical protein